MNRYLSVRLMENDKAIHESYLYMMLNRKLNTKKFSQKPIYVTINDMTSNDKQMFKDEQLEQVNNKIYKGVWYYKNFGYVLV